jgi:hypothetical protein
MASLSKGINPRWTVPHPYGDMRYNDAGLCSWLTGMGEIELADLLRARWELEDALDRMRIQHITVEGLLSRSKSVVWKLLINSVSEMEDTCRTSH